MLFQRFFVLHLPLALGNYKDNVQVENLRRKKVHKKQQNKTGTIAFLVYFVVIYPWGSAPFIEHSSENVLIIEYGLYVFRFRKGRNMLSVKFGIKYTSIVFVFI